MTASGRPYKPLDIIVAAKSGGKYRCLNCQAVHNTLSGDGGLNAHLAVNRRCSDAVRAFKRTLNTDVLDDPPYALSVVEQLSTLREIRDNRT